MGFFDSIGGTLSNINPFNVNSTIFGTSSPASGITNLTRTIGAVIQNIGNTLSFGAIPGAGNISSPLNTPLGAVSATIANNPLTTALVIATPFSGTARTVIGRAVGGLSNTQKILGGSALVAGVGIVRANPVGAITTALGAPSKLADFGTDIGIAINDPSIANWTTVIREHPVLSAGAGALALSTVAGGIGAATTAINTSAIRKNTTASESALAPVVNITQPAPAKAASTSVAPTSQGYVWPSPAGPAEAKPVAQPPGIKKKAKKKPKKKAKKKPKKKAKKKKRSVKRKKTKKRRQ
jgi:hypothetical protein